jgi:stage V sporulation protein B
MKKQSFIFGTLILSISGIICKILGAFYKIPLANILGSQGMGIYYLIFPVYAFFVTFVSSSFTVSISKNVSVSIAKNNFAFAHRVFSASLLLLFFIGLSLSVLLSVLCKVISTLQGFENAFVCYLILAPAIVVVAISSAFKGFFQGLHNMTPSATSQIINQVIKLATGYSLANILVGQGAMFGTIGAILGVTVAEFVTCAFFVVVYFVFKKRNKNFFEHSQKSTQPKLSAVMSMVFTQSVPFTLSSIILPMSLVIDSFLILNILKSIGFEKLFSTGLLGLNSGVVNTLVNLPSTLSVAVCMTIVPFISFALSKKDYESVSNKASLALKLTMLISLPCCFIFAIFSRPIISTLYSSSFESVYELNVASSLLSISAINIFYLSLLQLSTAFLQAINKSYVPVISLCVGLVLKVVFELIFISMPSLNIAGAVISNAVCYFTASIVNIIYFRRSVRLNFSFFKIVICPLIASITATFSIYVMMSLLQNVLSIVGSTLISIFVGIAIYVLAVFALRTFTKEERSALFLMKARQKSA